MALPAGFWGGMAFTNFTATRRLGKDVAELTASYTEARRSVERLEHEAAKLRARRADLDANLQVARRRLGEVEQEVGQLQTDNQKLELERSQLRASEKRLNATVVEQEYALRKAVLAAESARQSRNSNEQASRLLEDDLERARERADALDAELSDMLEREAPQRVSFEHTLAELGAANQRLTRAEERERLLLEQLEEANGALSNHGGDHDHDRRGDYTADQHRDGGDGAAEGAEAVSE